jgi:hypothetical protein
VIGCKPSILKIQRHARDEDIYQVLSSWKIAPLGSAISQLEVTELTNYEGKMMSKNHLERKHTTWFLPSFNIVLSL